LVVPDQDTNSLLIATASKYEQEVKDVIIQLDRPVPQVLIKCLVAEVTHDNGDQIGVDFSVLNIRSSQSGSYGATSTVNNVTSSSSGTAGTPFPTSLSPGSSPVGRHDPDECRPDHRLQSWHCGRRGGQRRAGHQPPRKQSGRHHSGP
jgi:type II secretory pathway component GspD/PulD (secretin)